MKYSTVIDVIHVIAAHEPVCLNTLGYHVKKSYVTVFEYMRFMEEEGLVVKLQKRGEVNKYTLTVYGRELLRAYRHGHKQKTDNA